MRLTLQERSAIAQAARDTLAAGTQVSLFGSRTDDNARGGDIDLLVETPLPMPAAEWVARRQAFVARLYRLLGERRIDVVVSSPAVAVTPPVVASARSQAIELVRT
ncbi:MAG: nucleotidyltransferase domain-containing protein [Rubrivivax sp.]|nr:nucleotidyltransferase domain-containing protein [Rubrivivax sp.]